MIIEPGSNNDPWWDTKQLLEQVRQFFSLGFCARMQLTSLCLD